MDKIKSSFKKWVLWTVFGGAVLVVGAATDTVERSAYVAIGGANEYTTSTGLLEEGQYAVIADEYWFRENGVEQTLPITATTTQKMKTYTEVGYVGTTSYAFYHHGGKREVEKISAQEYDDMKSGPMRKKMFVTVPIVEGAISVASSTHADTGGTKAISLTFSHDAGSSGDAVIVVGVQKTGANVSVSTVTYGGDSLTERVDSVLAGGSGDSATVWSYLTAKTSTNNVVITISSGTEHIGGAAASFEGADTSTSGAHVGATDEDASTGTAPSGTLTGASAGGALFDALYVNGGTTITADSNLTTVKNDDANQGGGISVFSGYDDSISASQAVTHSLGASNAYAYALFEIVAASAGGGSSDSTPQAIIF